LLYKYSLNKRLFSKSLGKTHNKAVIADRLSNFLNIFSFCSLLLHFSSHWSFQNRMLCSREQWETSLKNFV